MDDPHGRTLIIANGGLLSLLAMAAAREAVLAAALPDALRPVALLPHLQGPTAEARRAAALRHADLYDLELVESPVPGQASAAVGESQTHLLTHAAYLAASRGLACVVWPVRAGSGDDIDLHHAAKACDRAVLIARLVALDADEHGVVSIRVETPFLDLADRQIADVAIDLAVPARECWWWKDAYLARLERVGPGDDRGDTGLRPGEPEAWAEFRRWVTALRESGWASLTHRA
jgi:hypothetical protein